MWPRVTARPVRCRSNERWVVASAAAMDASCRCATSMDACIRSVRVWPDRCSTRLISYGIENSRVTMDLSVRIGSLTLRNPVIAASGCFGYGVEYADVVDLSSLGGVAVKGLFLAERDGHPAPRIVETPAGMLNAIGLQ